MAFPRLSVLTRRVLIAVALAMGGLAAFFGWAVYQSGAELRAAMAEAAQDDPRWRLHEMVRLSQVADDKNTVASLVERLAPTIAGAWKNLPSDAHFLAGGAVEPSENAIAALKRAVADNRALIEQLRMMSHVPLGHFYVYTTEPQMNSFSRLEFDAIQAKSFLELSAIVNCRTGSNEDAINDLIAIFRLARALSTVPKVSAIECRTSIEESAVMLAETLMSRSTITDGNLVRIDRVVVESELDPVAQKAYRGQRAVLFASYEKARFSGNSRSLLTSGKPFGRWEQLFAAELRKEQLDVLLDLNRHVAFTRLPTERRTDAIADLGNEVPSGLHVNHKSMIRKCHLIELDIRRIAMLRCLRAAIGAKRYWLAKRQWPDSLTQVAAAGYLKEVPIDPFTGKPLDWDVTTKRYKDRYPGMDQKTLDGLPPEVVALAYVRITKDGVRRQIAMPANCSIGGSIGVRLFNQVTGPNW
jgi:hypothetical protein